MAVRTPSAIGASGGAVADIAWRSPPNHSTSKPVIAVQKPAEIQPNRIANRIRIAISTNCRPWYGSTDAMKLVAIHVCARMSPNRQERRNNAIPCQRPRPARSRLIFLRWWDHGRGAIGVRLSGGIIASRTRSLSPVPDANDDGPTSIAEYSSMSRI